MKIFDFFNIKNVLKKDKIILGKKMNELENQGLELFFHAYAQIVSFKDAEIVDNFIIQFPI